MKREKLDLSRVYEKGYMAGFNRRQKVKVTRLIAGGGYIIATAGGHYYHAHREDYFDGAPWVVFRARLTRDGWMPARYGKRRAGFKRLLDVIAFIGGKR